MLYLNALGSAERLPFVPHLTLTNVVFEFKIDLAYFS